MKVEFKDKQLPSICPFCKKEVTPEVEISNTSGFRIYHCHKCTMNWTDDYFDPPHCLRCKCKVLSETHNEGHCGDCWLIVRGER